MPPKKNKTATRDTHAARKHGAPASLRKSPPKESPEPPPEFNCADHYHPYPRQEEFHRSRAKYRLFGGAAGPGKTKALLWEAIGQATEHPGIDTLLMRRTFPELESSLITQFRRDVPRDAYKSYNESKHLVTWLNGSTTRFGYSASEHDIYQYQGAEFAFIGVDELTHFTLAQWQFLTSRNRSAVPGVTPCMAAASNPGNIGHAWVKALWIDRQPAPGMDRPEQYDPADYAFIRATLADNPIYAEDAAYIKTLNALPTHQRQAFLLGDWSVVAGQYFDVFDVRRHTARAEHVHVELHWPRWISIDWGFEHPSAVYWHAVAPDNSVVTYREFVANHLSPRMLAQAIVERSVLPPESVYPVGEFAGRAASAGYSHSDRERIQAIYLSPDAFARHTSESTICDQLAEVLLRADMPYPAPADDDRIGGWMLLYQMLEQGKWTITGNCARLIECLPMLIRDPANVEDVLKVSGDDPADSARYGLKSRLAPGSVPPEERLRERISAADPTSRAIWMQKFMAEERRARRAPPLPHRW